MSKALPLTLFAASLTLASIASASASQIRTQVHGNGNDVRTTGYGHGPRADFHIEGNGLDVEAFAGPCPGGRPTHMTVRGAGERRLVIAPCIID